MIHLLLKKLEENSFYSFLLLIMIPNNSQIFLNNRGLKTFILKLILRIKLCSNSFSKVRFVSINTFDAEHSSTKHESDFNDLQKFMRCRKKTRLLSRLKGP